MVSRRRSDVYLAILRSSTRPAAAEPVPSALPCIPLDSTRIAGGGGAPETQTIVFSGSRMQLLFVGLAQIKHIVEMSPEISRGGYCDSFITIAIVSRNSE